MVASLIVYGSEKSDYEALEEADAGFSLTIARAEHELSPHGKPNIRTPIDFEYLDRGHVEALYNQIQPELPVMRQTTEDTAALKGSVSVETPAVAVGIGKTKKKNSSASFERIQFLPERQCIEVMKYVLDEGTAKYYTTAEDWHVNWLIRQLQESREAAKGPMTKDNMEKLRSPTLEEDRKASEKELQALPDNTTIAMACAKCKSVTVLTKRDIGTKPSRGQKEVTVTGKSYSKGGVEFLTAESVK